MPPHAHTRSLALLTAFASLLAALVISPLATEKAAAATTTWLPFDMPSKASMQASPRKVFGNWVVSLPISIDNKAPAVDYYQRHHLNPMGEGGKHKAYGGFLRDRPLGRAPIAGAWRLEDMKTEVRNAVAAGLDGFTVVMYGLPAPGKTSQGFENAKMMMQAAAAVDPGFKIIPMPDMTTLDNASTALVSSRMAELGRYSAAYKVNGKLVLQPFCAELKSVSWWKSVLSSMTNTHKVPVAFYPLILNVQAHASAFAPITYGMADWGLRDPVSNNPNNTSAWGPVGRIDRVQAMGDKWIQPISVQDERPRRGMYWEAGNTENFRNSWAVARKGGADAAQLLTWNDLPEGSGMLPSIKHGFTFLDLNAYYTTWFKTGVAPAITRDAVYLTHRKHKMAAKVTFPQTLWMTKRKGGTPGRDTVEALTFSKAAGVVQVTVGAKTYSCAVDAGVDTCTVPLGTGTVSARLVRSGIAVATLTSPFPVTATPYVQDFEYTGSSSLRQGKSMVVPAGSNTTTVLPNADSFVEAAKPTTNRGSNPALVADDGPASTAYLRFSLPAAPSGKRLTGASLKVTTTPVWYAGSTATHTVGLASSSWSERDISWGNRPAVTSPVGTIPVAARDRAYTTTLSATSLAGLLGKEVTLAVTGGTSDDGLFFASRDNADPASRPQLVLTFS